MTFQTSLFPLLITVGAAMLTAPAFACMADQPARGQVVLFESLASRKLGTPHLPQERSLRAGDLISVLAPARAVLTLVDEPRDRPQPVLLALDEARFRTLAAQGGGRVAPEADAVMGGNRAGAMSWHRFGAQGSGLVYIQLSHAGREGLIRLDVQPPKVTPRGQTVRGNENNQAEPLFITMFDSLELDLPGSPGDGWTVTPADARGLKLVAVEAVAANKAAEAASDRVRLRFSQNSALGPETGLTVSGAGKRFSFVIRSRAIPAC